MQTEVGFKIRDIVLLKSGGPNMTISQIEDKDDTKIIQTTWFAGSKNEHRNFPPEALTFPLETDKFDFSKLTPDQRAQLRRLLDIATGKIMDKT